MMQADRTAGSAALSADSGTRNAVAAALPGRKAEGHAKIVCAVFSGGAGQQLESVDSLPRERTYEPPDGYSSRTVVEGAGRPPEMRPCAGAAFHCVFEEAAATLLNQSLTDGAQTQPRRPMTSDSEE